MKNLLKDAFKITNNNIILTIPLILGVKILDLYSLYSKYTVDSAPKFILASLTMLFMFGVLGAAWFYMVRKAIDLSKRVFVLDSERANASLKLFHEMPEGIGQYFLSFVGVYAIFIMLQVLLTPFVLILGMKLIGTLDSASLLHLQSISASANSNAAMAAFVEQLTPDQIIFFGKWSLFFMFMTSIFMYFLMLWLPEILYCTKNPFVALFKSIQKIFNKFFESLGLYLFLWFSGFLLLFISTFSMINPWVYFVVSIFMFYFTVLFTILVFLYYDRNFVSCDEK